MAENQIQREGNQREGKPIIYTETKIRMTAEFSWETMQARDNGVTPLKHWNTQPRIIYSVKIYLSKIKVKRFFSDG